MKSQSKKFLLGVEKKKDISLSLVENEVKNVQVSSTFYFSTWDTQ